MILRFYPSAYFFQSQQLSNHCLHFVLRETESHIEIVSCGDIGIVVGTTRQVVEGNRRHADKERALK